MELDKDIFKGHFSCAVKRPFYRTGSSNKSNTVFLICWNCFYILSLMDLKAF